MACFRPARPYPSRLLALATVATALAAAPKAQATSYFWLGGAYDSWLSGFGTSPAQAATTDLYFGMNSSGGAVADNNGIVNNDVAVGFLLRQLNFSNRAWTMGGSSLRFAAGGGINVVNTNTATTVSNAMSLDGALTVAPDGASSLTLSGALSGAGSLVKTSAGTLILSGSNTFTGGTKVQNGRVIDLNPRGNYVTNDELELRVATAKTLTTVSSGSGNLTKSGAGTLTLRGIFNNTGTTTVKEGTLRSDAYNVLSNYTALVVEAGATFDLNGNVQGVDSLAGAGSVILGSGALGTLGNASTTFSGVISGAGYFEKNGSGTLTFTALNAYAGNTVVAGGRLVEEQPHGVLRDERRPGVLEGRGLRLVQLDHRHGLVHQERRGTLTLSGANSYTGFTSVTEGRLIDQNPHGPSSSTETPAWSLDHGQPTLAGGIYGPDR